MTGLFDPSRPQVAGRPALLGLHSVVPDLSFWPTPSGRVRVSAWLPIEPNVAKEFSRTVEDWEMVGILDSYRDDPEATLKLVLGWGPRPASTAEFSLEDIGL